MDERLERLTIDQLAATVGMTVRNIRAHQSRGLLPPPEIEGRTGYYGPSHVGRLRQIQALQDKGLNLAAIGHVVSDRLAELAAGPFTDETGVYGIDELVERLHVGPDEPAVARALATGVITLDGDQMRINTRLVQVAERFVAQGIPVAELLEVVDQVRVATESVAQAFMGLADRYLVVQVAADSGGDPDQIRAEVERLSGDAATAIDVLFNQAMAAAIRSYLGASLAGDGEPLDDGADDDDDQPAKGAG